MSPVMADNLRAFGEADSILHLKGNPLLRGQAGAVSKEELRGGAVGVRGQVSVG